MSALATSTDHRGGLVPVSLALARRSVSLIPRVPAAFIPSLVFPVIMLVAFSGSFGAMVMLPGFPVQKMVSWILPMSVVQGAAFSGATVGMGVARDLENGFFDRLLLAPVDKGALVLGPMVAAVLRAAIPFALVLPAGLLVGADLKGGLPGLVVLLVAAMGAALAASGWAIGLAFRIPSQQSGPLIQVGMFLAVFTSTAQVPLAVMTGWLKLVAGWNPVTHVLELGRQGFIGHVTWADTWPGLVAIVGMTLLTGTFAARGLRRLTP